MSADERATVLLYVEDEVLTQGVVETALHDAGFQIVVASDGEEALNVLDRSAHTIRGLITDVNLGGESDGWAVARRGREMIPGLPVVYVSGANADGWRFEGVPQSVMVAKPFVAAQIVVAIAALLNAVGCSDEAPG